MGDKNAGSVSHSTANSDNCTGENVRTDDNSRWASKDTESSSVDDVQWLHFGFDKASKLGDITLKNSDSKMFQLEAEVDGSFQVVKPWESWSENELTVFQFPTTLRPATAVRVYAQYPNGHVNIKHVNI